MAPFNPDVVRFLNNQFQDQNGGNVYSNEKAMYGYIAESKYLVITPTICNAMKTYWESDKSPDFSVEDMGQKLAYSKIKDKVGGVNEYLRTKSYLVYGKTNREKFELNKVLALNYVKLRAAGLNAANAFACASLRTRWLSLGCLITTSDTEVNGLRTPHVEVEIATPTTGTIPDEDKYSGIKNAILKASDLDDLAEAFDSDEDRKLFEGAASNANFGLTWTVYIAEAVWAICEYLFRTRGHHFKDEFRELIEKMFSSTFEGTLLFPKDLDMAEVFRTAIHPFGVAALPLMTFHFALAGKLGHAMLIRLDAAPNGLAVITTTAAAMDCMKTESWYKAFYMKMQEEVDLVVGFTDTIMADKYNYHMAHGLYGSKGKQTLKQDGKEYTLAEAKSAVSATATVVEGFISYLTEQKNANNIRGFTLENAKSLKKPASSNPTLVIKVKFLCSIVAQAMEDSLTPSDAVEVVFPSIQVTQMQVQQEALPATKQVPAIKASA